MPDVGYWWHYDFQNLTWVGIHLRDIYGLFGGNWFVKEY